MAVKRKSYTPEYKLAAVKMILEQKLAVAEATEKCGRNVLRQLEEGAGTPREIRDSCGSNSQYF